MSFSLTSSFEDEFEYQGKVIMLDLAFDNVLRLFELFKDNAFSTIEKVEIALEILLSSHSHEYVDPLNIVEKHTLFLYIMKEFLDIDLENPSSEATRKLYDFEKDAGIIFASFLNAYNMDLFEQQGKLHWKKFIQLFSHLPDKTAMKEVIRIRTEKVPAQDNHNAEYRRNLMKLKSLYSLDSDFSSEDAQREQIKRNEENFEKLALAWKRKPRG